VVDDPAIRTEQAGIDPGAGTVEPSELAGTVGRPDDQRRRNPARNTRASATWAALAAGLFFLIVLLVFILQNLRSVRVHFFWATWSVPLAVDLLLATVLGGLIMFAGGATRIIQLRRQAKT
jgi:uncharacterized integral membrane protein